MTGPPLEMQVRLKVAVVAFGSVVSWNWREVTSRFPGEIKILVFIVKLCRDCFSKCSSYLLAVWW